MKSQSGLFIESTVRHQPKEDLQKNNLQFMQDCGENCFHWLESKENILLNHMLAILNHCLRL